MALFRRYVVVDFEYETITPGNLPNPLCMVCYLLDENLRYIETIRRWRGEFGPRPPFPTDDDTLFIAYSAWAELMCFIVLGWIFPVHVFDCHTCYQATTNFLLPATEDGEERKKPRKRLSDACRAYGIIGWENIDKPQMAKDIGEGRWHLYGRPAVFDYCEEDVRRTTELFRRQLDGIPGKPWGLQPADVPCGLHWSEYSAKVIARVQAKGKRIDVPLWNLCQENKAAIVRELVRRFDPSQDSDDPIFDVDGSFENARFARYLIENGIPWPRLPSGAFDLKKKTFKMMGHIPGIQGISALRESLRVIISNKLPIGSDGINRPSLFPFGTSTGRNAHAKSLFNCHAALRSFIRFPEDKIGVYLDWGTQEPAIAAVKSGDQGLIAAYLSGDVYHDFAWKVGLTTEPDRKVWAKQCADMREQMKHLYLAINYGMKVRSLARQLGRHPLIASGLLEAHRRKHRTFWNWREVQVMQALLTRNMFADDGWPLLITTSPPLNTLYNFPMQSGGAVMLRETAIQLCEAGYIPSMLIHDGILFELDRHEQIEEVKAIMAAGAARCLNGFPVRVGVEQHLEHGARYRDKRDMSKKLWATIMDVLGAVGALDNRDDIAA
jgi:hypothetical protein